MHVNSNVLATYTLRFVIKNAIKNNNCEHQQVKIQPIEVDSKVKN